MTAKTLLTDIYTSDEIKDVLLRLEPADLRDDIKQHVFVELLAMEESFILDLHTRGKLKHWVVKMLYNTSRWRDRSAFKKQYGFLEMSVADFDIGNIIENIESSTAPDEFNNSLASAYKNSIERKVCTDDRTQAEVVEEILLALKAMYWYKAEMFKLYVKYGTYQKVADATGINITSIYQTVRQAKREIKNYIQ